MIAKIVVAQPANPAGLRKIGGSLYELTTKADTNPLTGISGTVAAMNTELGSGMLGM